MNIDMKKIKETLQNMTVEQKLGHLVVCRGLPFKGEDEEYFYDKLSRGCIGAVQGPINELFKDMPFKIREIAPNPILICADMETGFPRSKRKLPSALALATATGDDFSLAYEFGRITAIEAKAAGFNMVWGPVVDILSTERKENVQRNLGTDSYKVAKLGEAIARGYADEGMFFTAKHCPCSIDVFKDTHLYSDNKSKMTEEDIMKTSMIPYMEMLKNDMLMGIMTRHGMFPEIDPDYPPTLSEKIIKIIRSIGFDGVITTDSLGMVGIINKYGEDTCIGKSIQAGHDMIIPNYRITYRETMERLENAYNNGVFTDERLDEAVRRVLIAQQKAIKPASQSSIGEKELAILDRINSDSVCAFTDEGVSASIDKNKSHLFVILTENLYLNEDGETYEVAPVVSWKPQEMKKALEDFYPDCRVELVPEYPSQWHMHEISYHSTHYDDVVFLTFCKQVPYGVHDRIHLRMTRLMEAIQAENRIAAVMHIGNPYAVEALPHIPRVIIGFSGGECEKYALEVLMGKREAIGKMPLDLKLK